MAKKFEIKKDEFEGLLLWLDADLEEACRKYEEIRIRLIKFFEFRRCLEPEALADETIDRVARLKGGFTEDYTGEPSLFFYGVAKKVFLEFTRLPRTEELSSKLIGEHLAADEPAKSEFTEAHYECLLRCLEKLPDERRQMITRYYENQQRAKIIERKKIGQDTGVSKETLRVQMFRIRKTLKKCVLSCVRKEKD